MIFLDNKEYKKTVSEALLRQAVIDDHMNELNAIPSSEELTKLYAFSERHELRMKKLFAAAKRKERVAYWVRFAQRAAAVIAIATTVLFASLLTVPTVRAAVSETIIEWFEKYTRYSYKSNSTEITVVDWFFEYVPDGYVLNENYDVGEISYVMYTNESSNEIVLMYSQASNVSVGVDNEYKEFEIVFADDIEYHVYKGVSEDYPSNILWVQNNYSMNLKGYCSVNDLLRMAQSVQK